jgi:HSP20 family molecular chaperone IbpA
MQLMRRQEAWDPFREVEQLGIRLNRRLGPNRWPRDGKHEEMRLADWVPSCNVIEKDDEYHVRAELPDVTRDRAHIRQLPAALSCRPDESVEDAERLMSEKRRAKRPAAAQAAQARAAAAT